MKKKLLAKKDYIKLAYIAALLLAAWLVYALFSRFLGFILQTVFYLALVMVMLVFLKKKGFFKDAGG